jgi:hypothetical protein
MVAFFTGLQGEQEPDFRQASNSSQETATSDSTPLLLIFCRPIDASMPNVHPGNNLQTFRKCNSRNSRVGRRYTERAETWPNVSVEYSTSSAVELASGGRLDILRS